MEQLDTFRVDELEEVRDQRQAVGGRLSELGRRQAIASSIALLGTYFVEGQQPLRPQKMVGPGNAEEPSSMAEVVLAGIRLRVSIAAASKLIDLVRSIDRRPNFRYELRQIEQVGSLNGQLDVTAWVEQMGSAREQLIFPTVESARSARTPENILIAYSLAWTRRELNNALRASTARPGSVEARTVRTHLRDLTRLASAPGYAACRMDAMALRGRRAVEDLVARVLRRAKRRETTNATPYAELARWILSALHGSPPVDVGDIEWAFYGPDFDRTLFELWCVHHLMKLLSQRLDQKEPALEPRWLQKGITYRFTHFAGEIELIYQTAFSTVSGLPGRWKMDGGNSLGGRPDITVTVTPRGGPTTYVILDPKLRQRPGMPTEELYKLLGYFENFNVHPRRGAILFYSTDEAELTHYQLRAGPAEDIAAIRLNPAALDGATGLNIAIDLILAGLAMELPHLSSTETASNLHDDLDARAEKHALEVRRQLLAWASSHEAAIKPSMNLLEGLLATERWEQMDNELQTMLATAVCIGNQLEADADYSGPILGMCAALEGMLVKYIITPLIKTHPEYGRDLKMIGPIVSAITAAVGEEEPSGRYRQLHLDLRDSLEATGASRSLIQELVPRWTDMNRRFRRPAAHHESMSRVQWQGTLNMFLSERLLTDSWNALPRGRRWCVELSADD